MRVCRIVERRTVFLSVQRPTSSVCSDAFKAILARSSASLAGFVLLREERQEKGYFPPPPIFCLAKKAEDFFFHSSSSPAFSVSVISLLEVRCSLSSLFSTLLIFFSSSLYAAWISACVREKEGKKPLARSSTEGGIHHLNL